MQKNDGGSLVWASLGVHRTMEIMVENHLRSVFFFSLLNCESKLVGTEDEDLVVDRFFFQIDFLILLLLLLRSQECMCCRETFLRERVVTLTVCFDPRGNRLHGRKSHMDIKLREPAECRCTRCGESPD